MKQSDRPINQPICAFRALPGAGGRVSRRDLLTWAISSAATLSGSGCGSPGSAHSVHGRLDNELPVARLPLAVAVYPLARPPFTKEEMRRVVYAAQPPKVTHSYPPTIVYHAIRVWGRSASFAKRDFSNSAVRGRWGSTMFRILTEDKVFKEFSAPFRVDHLLVPSQYGVMVRCNSDAGWGGQFTSSHPGKYLQIMAELRIPSDFPLQVMDGKSHSIADVIQDEARRLTYESELEWLAGGLGRYLTVGEWQNRFGEWVSFDGIAEHLIGLSFGQGSCMGGHIPYALASLVAVQAQSPVLSGAVFARTEERIREYSAHVTARQRGDGGWGCDWANRTPETERFLGGLYDRGGDIDRLTVTGHQLEWMTICRPDLRPADTVLECAGRYLVRAVPQIGAGVEVDWHAYLPLSHAVKALLALNGIEQATEDLCIDRGA